MTCNSWGRSVSNENWVGPFRIKDLLSASVDGRLPRPPESESAYLVSRYAWIREPNEKCKPLYVGGTTGRSARFRTRIGDLLADLFGFFGTESSHHSGGRSLHQWCKENKVNPLQLYIAWVRKTRCHRCLEISLVNKLNPSLNKKSPARCPKHIF